MSVLVERDNIGIFGCMNTGKSSVMNLITQQNTSIVDHTPGTTADTKAALHEIHGIGPVRILDTAGIDEESELGAKKKRKVLQDLKECDLVLLVLDPSRGDFTHEEGLLAQARDQDKQILIIYNIFRHSDETKIAEVETAMPVLRFHQKITIRANDESSRMPLVDFLIRCYEPEKSLPELLPFVVPDEFYVLVIPMDVETPPGRYLRPQAMTEEYITRHWAYPVSFRLDLAAARKGGNDADRERTRFFSVVHGLGKKPKCIITDSQAMDVLSRWCPEDIDLTTFSIVMIHYMSGGKLEAFRTGLRSLGALRPGDSILIAEACNHTRIGEDIGTVQIPHIIARDYPGVRVDHAFGREFQDNKGLQQYSLIIHCGGCMITRQKLLARIRDLESLKVPYTNYGLFLSYAQGERALAKVLKPWGVDAERSMASTD